MTFLRPRARARWSGLLAVWLAALAGIFATGTATAHEGHDHGAAPASTAQPASPRVVAVSETYQLVGIVEGDALVVYLDRAADNAPVTTAKLEISIDGTAFPAQLQKNGTYEVVAPFLKSPGIYEVLANISDGDTSDLLVGSVTVPAAAGAGLATHTIWDHLPNWAKGSYAREAGFAVLGALVAGLGLLMWSRVQGGKAKAGALVLAAASIASPGGGEAIAHEGHDHGAPVITGGNGPHRRPDGVIFLPKPSQRLLEVRTWIVKPETAVPSRRFAGRVIANPNRSGVVQSTIQGRYIAPDKGVPAIGTKVLVGDLLGRVAPSFASIDASQIAQTLAEFDQQITLARARLARLEPLLASNTVAVAQVDEARINLNGLIKRRAEVAISRVQAEELRSPVNGVIAGVRIMSGQVVSPSEVIFQIIDPSSLMVEALAFSLGSRETLRVATALLSDGRTVRLDYVGRSRSLQQQYAQVQFAVQGGGDAALDVGQAVKVVAEIGAPLTGIVVARAALAQAPSGQTVLFRQKEPELFEPKPVRFEPFDAERVRILAGIEPGETIVVQGAPLVNQVR
jgi:cobalt-zinc-cadmium efflux system membrane fusion protein